MLSGFGMWLGISYLLYSNLFIKTEREKIELTFKNINFGLSKQYPQHLYTHNENTYIVYGFSLPYGLTDHPKIEIALEKTLNKPVKMTMDSHLKVKVYNGDLPKEINYDWDESEAWSVPVGHSLDGIIYHNFDKIPHMSISGTTRYGKTVLLKLIFAHLIKNNPEVELYIVDFKRLEFSRYRNIEQVKWVARDKNEAKDCLKEITERMGKDMEHFENKGYNNIANTNIKRRTFIIIDEGGQLDKSLHGYLEKIAQMGGGIGYRLIFATQYGTGDVFPRQVKQNSDAKIAFRLPTEVASRVAIDESGAEQIDNVGRAIYRTAERHLIQVPYVDDTDIEKQLEKYRRYDEVDSAEESPEERRKNFVVLE